MLAGVLVGALMGWLLQGASLANLFDISFNGYTSETGMEAVDELLTNGGMKKMLPTVALVICALGFGGVMERTGMLAVLAGSVIKLARTTGSLVTATVFTCTGMNVIAPDRSRNAYVFYKDKVQVNNIIDRIGWSGMFASPRTPRGWKKVVDAPPQTQSAGVPQEPKR